jgi:LmbE family N-acetylglucosaminyl deacetylase
MTRRTLLGVWAHPDDEAYLSAGLMLEYTARGDRVVVVTATFGEHGTDDPDAWPPLVLAARRRAELNQSLATLGVHEHHVLGYEDGHCQDADGTAEIAGYIATIGPDVIVTFGADGMTGHPDHRAVSSWTTAAWAATASSAELWYATLTPRFHARWGQLNARIGLWSEQPAPPTTEPDELRHVVELTGRRLDTKMAALRAHRSQTAPLARLVGSRAYRHWWSTETFRAAGAPAGEKSDRAVRDVMCS